MQPPDRNSKRKDLGPLIIIVGGLISAFGGFGSALEGSVSRARGAPAGLSEPVLTLLGGIGLIALGVIVRVALGRDDRPH